MASCTLIQWSEHKTTLDRDGKPVCPECRAPAEMVIGIKGEPCWAHWSPITNKPISELKLSIRARKCMIRSEISTIAELVRRSGDDLLERKNFGVVSLNEIRKKLRMRGLTLRGE